MIYAYYIKKIYILDISTIMEKLKFEENIYNMSLSELKNILYSNKKNNKDQTTTDQTTTDKNNKEIIRNIINNKIEKSLIQKKKKSLIEEKNIIKSIQNINDNDTNSYDGDDNDGDGDDNSNDNNSNDNNSYDDDVDDDDKDDVDSDDDDDDDDNGEDDNDYNYDKYKDNIKKLYDRSDKKGEKEKCTQSSQKLFDRMFSHAQILNNSYNDVNINKISRPFVNDKLNDRKLKLGDRKFIKK